MADRCFHSQHGIGLIEILVAVLVLSVGLLGLAALQGFALKGTRAAYHHTQAGDIAYALLDYLRAHHEPVCAGGPGDAPGFAATVEHARSRLPQGQITVQMGGDCEIEVIVGWHETTSDGDSDDEFRLASRL